MVLPVVLTEILDVFPVILTEMVLDLLPVVLTEELPNTIDNVLEDINGTRHRIVPFYYSFKVSTSSLPPWIEALIQVEVLSPAHSL
jgi:hypothetical protein